jgi:hypothetical protein
MTKGTKFVWANGTTYTVDHITDGDIHCKEQNGTTGRGWILSLTGVRRWLVPMAIPIRFPNKLPPPPPLPPLK